MQYRGLGSTGYQVSAITYGGIVSKNDGQAASDRYIPWAIDRGVNYFDVAPKYGDAQEKLGNALRPYRGGVYLACKTVKRTRAEAEADMRESLRLLHTDHFDVYQLHQMSDDEDLRLAFGPGGVMELLRDMREKGIARKIGITAHSERIALKALELFDFDTVLFPYNWHMHMAHGFGEKLLRRAKQRGIGVLGMKSMIKRAWIPGADAETRAMYPKSWCKPFRTDTQAELLVTAMKYAWSLGVDTLIPAGDYDHFSFAVENVDRILDQLLRETEIAALQAHLEEARDWPFFGQDMFA